jgi:hypothetical protein
VTDLGPAFETLDTIVCHLGESTGVADGIDFGDVTDAGARAAVEVDGPHGQFVLICVPADDPLAVQVLPPEPAEPDYPGRFRR